uniref:C2 domain-containing protein n=1 Tax=Ananas comosus var. bracteatus TaxID=296719 RepID=A0A6V7NM53_ANACO|nr:unnamed protein product [Ananas comosus var. bracteatus]
MGAAAAASDEGDGGGDRQGGARQVRPGGQDAVPVRARGARARLPAGAAPRVRVAAHGRRASTREARRAGPTTSGTAPSPSPRTLLRRPRRRPRRVARGLRVGPAPGEEDDHDADADDAEGEERHLLGALCFDASEVPLRDPPDGPWPQWYRLEGPGGGGGGGQLMLATWIGTQADESFADAWKADAPPSAGSSRAKVYVSPKLWYLRVTVIEAQDALASPTRDAAIAVAVRAALGSQVLRTRAAACRGGAPSWNEDLIFVAAEPFGEDERLLLSLEIRGAAKDAAAAAVGSAALPLSAVERRVDDRTVATRWLDLLPTVKKKGARDRDTVTCRGEAARAGVPGRGYHGLLPMRTLRGKGSTDAYAVAKYGPKWARTRTVADSLDPAWNEQYTWPVYDPCTVLTLAVFDESPPSDPDAGPKDPAHPVLPAHGEGPDPGLDPRDRSGLPRILPVNFNAPGGAKRMGEIELAVRFARAGSVLDLVHAYGLPMLPQCTTSARSPGTAGAAAARAARVLAAHLSRSEPSLRREVVLWMLDAAEPRGFSMRKVRANWHRIVAALAWTADAARWVEDTRNWRNPTATALAHGALVLLAWHPDLLLPVLAVHFAAVGAWRYRRRLQGPVPHPCVRVSMAETADREELDEEFDPVPSTRPQRCGALCGPIEDDGGGGGVYYLRHPMFRDRMPPAAHNFFRRLPALSERII